MSDLAQDLDQHEGQGFGPADGSGATLVAGRFAVSPSSPLVHLNQPNAEAFAASDRQGAQRPLFALVCGGTVAPRFDMLGQLSRFDRLPMLLPLDWDVVDWAPAKGRRCIIVFEQPDGERVQAHPGASFQPFKEDDVVRKLVQPLLPLLRDFKSRALTHRSIRADNIFFKDANRSELVLGECVSDPPGMSQPLIYETIESGQALPEGRGFGFSHEEAYAFGVLMAVLLRGELPGKDKSDQEILQAKISRGSYAAVVDRLRVSLPMMEVLRGLLCDDYKERWTIEELEAWANGRHLSPKQPVLPPKAARAYTFTGSDYWSCKALSAAMGADWTAARSSITDDELVNWIHRSVGNEELAEEVGSALRSGELYSDSTSGRSDRALSRVLMTLDPRAPLRYRNFSARIDALMPVLATDFDRTATQQLFTELMAHRLPQSWIDAQPVSRPEYTVLRKSFDSMSYYLSRPRVGYGIERCLYEFNEGWPCLSPLIRDQFVIEIGDLLPALERLAQRDTPQREPVDRHIAAFVAANMRGTPERILSALDDEDDEQGRRLAMLHLLAEVQSRHGPKSLPGLATWLSRIMGPVVESYHSRNNRQSAAEAIERAGRSGSLEMLARVADNGEMRSSDQKGFDQAQTEYRAILKEMQWLEQGGLTSPEHIREKGQQAAAVVAGCLSGITLLLLTLMYVNAG